MNYYEVPDYLLKKSEKEMTREQTIGVSVIFIVLVLLSALGN